jgi:altronate dehydratase large subunit
MYTFSGYRRPDGGIGVRNYVAILSTVCCANAVAEQIANAVPECRSICHGHGCGRRPERPMHNNVLVGLGTNPNIYGVIEISLGCEGTPAEPLRESIAASGRPVELLVIQDRGTQKTIERGIELARKMVQDASKLRREEFPVSELMLGLECGGSDALSGVTANPSIGVLSDWLVEQGGTTVLTETTELIGTTHILSRRAANDEVRRRIEQVIEDAHKNTLVVLGENAARAIAPGNMDGGMSTIQEKALGCVRKGGTSTINEVVDYGIRPAKKGLVIMDGPGFDAESLSGLGAMGCQVMIFSTGRGNPLGFPIIPVIKVASNDRVYERMKDDIDLNAGMLLDEDYSFDDVRRDFSDFLLRVAGGEKTKAEINGQSGYVCLWSYSKSL